MDYVKFYGTELIQRPSNDGRLDYTVFESLNFFFYISMLEPHLTLCLSASVVRRPQSSAAVVLLQFFFFYFFFLNGSA